MRKYNFTLLSGTRTTPLSAPSRTCVSPGASKGVGLPPAAPLFVVGHAETSSTSNLGDGTETKAQKRKLFQEWLEAGLSRRNRALADLYAEECAERRDTLHTLTVGRPKIA